MNPPSIGNPGFGLGLRTAHYQDFLGSPQPVDWLEIITDNFLVDGGKPLVVLETIRRDYPIAMHGVAMSIGSASGLDLDYLARVDRLARRIEPMWISDHLCWTGFATNMLHDLYPMPYTEESARLLVAQIRQAQDFLQRRLVIENVSSYVRFSSSTRTEWDFLAHVIEEADCELLLDLNNVYVSSINHGFSPASYLDALPAARVRQIHLAGHSLSGAHTIDTHDHPVTPEVWALYASACRRFPHVATMIERDDNIPPLATLIEELDQARAIAASLAGHTASVEDRGVRPWTEKPLEAGKLAVVQRHFAEYVLNETPPSLPAGVDQAGPLSGARGMQIYHHAYRARLTEVLADGYAKCRLYLGSELFAALADRYIDAHPSQERHLGRYGAAFAVLLASHYPDNDELIELAQMEWSLREVFDAADVPAWTALAIQGEGTASCLAQWPILHPSLRLHSARTNAVTLWRAIDADEDVPEVVRWEHPRALAVWRKGLQPHFKTLDSAEAEFLTELAHDGTTIAAVAQAWVASGKLLDPAVLAAWLAAWWADEILRRDVAA